MENKLVRFTEQFRELTRGVCTMGPGPYGIGVSTDTVSPLRAILLLTPDPFEENSHLPDGQECAAEMRAYVEAHRQLGKYLSQDELLEFSQGDDPAASIVAEAVIRMNETKSVVTVRECLDAFDILADREINDRLERTGEERAFIDSLAAQKGGHGMTMSM